LFRCFKYLALVKCSQAMALKTLATGQVESGRHWKLSLQYRSCGLLVFFLLLRKVILSFLALSRISILCSNSSQRPPTSPCADRGKFPVLLPLTFSSFKVQDFCRLIHSFTARFSHIHMLMFWVFEYSRKDFGRGMVFGLASFWSWGFLGGFVVVGYGGFCRWEFSVLWGGGLVHGVWICPATHLHHNFRPSISSPSFLSLPFPRRLGPIEQIAICPSQPLNSSLQHRRLKRFSSPSHFLGVFSIFDSNRRGSSGGGCLHGLRLREGGRWRSWMGITGGVGISWA